eukprot:Seg4175.4 transcript_id=Seg4175.4/GoldUCD/mRNA.D3Y31 product="hypothetical protein" protein_id=Seg4175.4/GoldUCD/D3Y31
MQKLQAGKGKTMERDNKVESVVGYVHRLSPLKKSQNKNTYFDLCLQTKSSTYRTVCFSPEKHDYFKTSTEATSPVKITRPQKKMNEFTHENEIIVSKRAKLEEPSSDEVDFEYDESLSKAEDNADVQEVSVCDAKTLTVPGVPVNMKERVTFHGEAEEKCVRGRALQFQEAILTDTTGSIRLVLWHLDIGKVQSGQTYSIKKAVVKCFKDANYITFVKGTEVTETDETIDSADEVPAANAVHCSVECPPEGIQFLRKHFVCNKCHFRCVPSDEECKMFKCSECGMIQLKGSC